MKRRLATAACAVAVALTACCPPAVATSDAASPPTAGPLAQLAQDATYAARFETAWALVDHRYWNLDAIAVDWNEVGERYRAQVADVDSDEELYDLLEAMYEEIGDHHSVYLSPERADEVRDTYGDLPCLALLDGLTWLPAPGLSAQAGSVPGASAADIATGSLGTVTYGIATAGADTVGYLRLPDLATAGVPGWVRQAVGELEAGGATALVLDLRGNPGGRLVTMMQVAGVFTSGFLWRAVLAWSLPVPYPAVGEPATDLPLYVLVDAGVNSAAEGLVGALQDVGRATVVGERTAGNVEAVLPFCLRDGSQAWIATGVLAPLLGATWEGRGIVPDVIADPEHALDAALAQVEGRP